MAKQEKFGNVQFGSIEYTHVEGNVWTIVNKYPLTARSLFAETDLKSAVSCGHSVVIGHWGREVTMLAFWKGKLCPTCQAKAAVAKPADVLKQVTNKTLKSFYEGRLK